MPDELKAPTPELLARFAAIVGEKGQLTAPADVQPYCQEWRDKYFGKTPMVLRPASTAEVSAILKLANEERIAIVPQGGNTGLVGGQTPLEAGTELVLSLDRMKAVRAIDPAGNTITAEAGATLKAVQDAAAGVNRLFPLSLAAEGTCQIGGNIATNAGGVHVLRYGTMRDLVLGIEAVFPGGEIWNGLRTLRKDNTGYDLRSLLIGSEGTLGVITAASLKLFPRPAEVATVIVACQSLEAAGQLFTRAFESAGPMLTAFELIPRIAMEFLTAHMERMRDPLEAPYPWYALIEVAPPVADAAVAASEGQARDFWAMRENISEIQKHEGGSIKHDVSVPVSAIPAFIAEADAEIERLVPGARPVPFGHYGDGNIHYNISQPVGADKDAYLARWEEVSDAVHAIVGKFGGSISAEHGIGRMKAEALERVKSPVELAMMRRLKDAFDPRGILSPGRVLLRKDVP